MTKLAKRQRKQQLTPEEREQRAQGRRDLGNFAYLVADFFFNFEGISSNDPVHLLQANNWQAMRTNDRLAQQLAMQEHQLAMQEQQLRMQAVQTMAALDTAAVVQEYEDTMAYVQSKDWSNWRS
jgi:lipopolysaccharide biosynthesis glycosyltransferase